MLVESMAVAYWSEARAKGESGLVRRGFVPWKRTGILFNERQKFPS
jgi:hypothetical protein